LLIYEVAFHLKIPIYRLAHEMPYEELLGWMAYFERRPIGWREDDRTHKLLQAQGVKAKAVDIFPSLQALYSKPAKKEGNKMDIKNFKGSLLYHKIMSAKGGDKIDYDKS